MKKLDKSTIENRNKIQGTLSEAFNELSEAVDSYNTAMHNAWMLVNAAMDKYNNAVSDANSWLGEAASSIQEYIDNRSENWQQSDKGTTYEAWKEEYEEELSTVDFSEPEELDLNDVEDPSEVIGNKNEEVPA